MRLFFNSIIPWRSFNRSLRLFLIAVVVDGIIASAWQLFYNFYILALGYDKSFLGLINSVNFLAGLLLAIPLGVLSDRIGRRKAMLLGLLIYSAAACLQVVVRVPAVMLLMSFLVGMGYTLYLISQAPFLMAESDEKNRALLFSLSYGIIPLAGTLGSFLAGQMPSFFAGWLHVLPNSADAYRAVLLFSVILGTAGIIPIFFIKERQTASTNARSSTQAALRLLRRPLILKLALPGFLIGIGAGLVIPYLNVFLQERFGISDQALGILFGVSSLLTGIGCLIGPMLARRLKSEIITVVITQGLAQFFLLLLGFSNLVGLASLGFLMRVAFMNMAQPLYSHFSMEQVAPHEQGAANGIFNIAWNIGWVFGPFISGLVQQRYGFAPLFVAMAVMYSTAILLTLIFFRPLERQQQRALSGRVTGETGVHTRVEADLS